VRSALAITLTAFAAASAEEAAAPTPDMAEIEHGSYLVHRVAMCVQCHSSRDKSGELASHRLLEGAAMPLASPFPYQIWASAAPPLAGLPTGYTDDDLVTLLVKGKARTGRTLLRPMPPYRMTEPDARAIAAYLKWAGAQTEVKDVSRDDAPAAERAIATLRPTEGNKVSGVMEFVLQDGVMHITANLMGLTPGLHGIHIHENGDCSAADATSSGGHFNPDAQPHGDPNVEQRHLGDLGNIVADEKGYARYERVDPHLTFAGPRSIIGRSVVVDERPDDLTTQPDGNSGAHQSCGTIRRM
jgi:Cu-Zn family superoxide dismutase